MQKHGLFLYNFTSNSFVYITFYTITNVNLHVKFVMHNKFLHLFVYVCINVYYALVYIFSKLQNTPQAKRANKHPIGKMCYLSAESEIT